MSNNIQKDKLLHFFCGSIIGLIGLIFGLYISIFLVISAAIGKEFSGKGNPELLDIVYTIFGGSIPIIGYILNLSN
jgi:hypothetical protein